MQGGIFDRRIAAISLLAAVGMVTSGLGCAQPVGTTAASMLRKIRESDDPNLRHLAYGKLGAVRVYDNDQEKIEAADLLASRLIDGKEPVASRAVICHTLGQLRRHEAREALIRAVSDPEPPVRAAACLALGRCGEGSDSTILAKIMTIDPVDDVKIAAIEGLGELKSGDVRIDIKLLDGMEDPDPAVRLASYEAIRTLTGKDFGRAPADWKKYVSDKSQLAKAEQTKADQNQANGNTGGAATTRR